MQENTNGHPVARMSITFVTWLDGIDWYQLELGALYAPPPPVPLLPPLCAPDPFEPFIPFEPLEPFAPPGIEPPVPPDAP